LTKLDVLSGFDTLKVCVAYSVDGEIVEEMPMHQSDVHHAEPVWDDVKGWGEDLAGVGQWDDLPVSAQDYVRRLEQLMGVPIRVVSVGPAREQTLEVP